MLIFGKIYVFTESCIVGNTIVLRRFIAVEIFHPGLHMDFI